MKKTGFKKSPIHAARVPKWAGTGATTPATPGAAFGGAGVPIVFTTNATAAPGTFAVGVVNNLAKHR